MQHNRDRIITTHVGSLPRPRELLAPLAAKDGGEPHDRAALGAGVRRSVRAVVERQLQLGIDIVNDGEHSKSSFSSYARTRLGGLTLSDRPTQPRSETRDSAAFTEAYAEMKLMYAARHADTPGRRKNMAPLACTGPLTYIGRQDLDSDIANLRDAVRETGAAEGFMTAISPTNLELYFRNEYYRSEEEYLTALADALNQEYRAIIAAGFVLQIDDPRLATHYSRVPDASIEDCRRFIAERIEVLNYALTGIPEEKVRYHTCYSVNVAPRLHELELKHYVDLMLRIKAGAYSIEGANPRHEHEWQVWEAVKLPAGKILIPGVISHCVTLVEHPELVAQRIGRFATILGRENVIASNDCGFATSAAGDELHPTVAWAKLEALVEGARIASAKLWSKAA